jgi:phosphoserine phosphatase
VNLSGELDIDISFQKDNIYRRNRRLICFDMDSTLIKTEVIDELAESCAGEEVRAITEAAMRGEIDFSESFKKSFSFKGLDESVMQEIADNLPIMDGADRLMHILKNAVIKLQFFLEVLPILGIILKNVLEQIIYMLTNSKLLMENLRENI